MANSFTSLARRFAAAGLLAVSGLGAARAQGDPLAYLLTHVDDPSGSSSQITTLDLLTGAQGSTVKLTLNGADVVANALEYLPGKSTYYTSIDSSVYTVDPGTGQLSLVGDTGLDASAFGIATTATGLYGGVATASHFELYSLDTATAAPTFIGSSAITVTGNADLSSGTKTLYFLNDEGAGSPTARLYAVDTGAGSAALVGDTGVGDLQGLIEAGKTYYTLSDDGAGLQRIFSIDPSTAKVTFITDVSGPAYAPWGLAPVASVPEPGTGGALLVGLAVLAGVGRARRIAARAGASA